MCSVVLGLVLFGSGAVRAEEDVKSAAIGGLTASFLVQTYFNVGLLADASVKKDADKDTLVATLSTVEKLLSSTETHMDALMKSDQVGEDDKEYLKKIKTCYALLDEQISSLHKFWKEPTDENAKAFESARVTAWKKISETLGIK
jgi:hypothetical protein